MCEKQRYSRRSAEYLISDVCERAVRTSGVSAPIGKYLESLIWPFVCRRSLREVWFTDKDYARLVNATSTMAKRIASQMSPDDRQQTYLKYYLDLALCAVVGSMQESDKPKSEPWILEAGSPFSGILRCWLARAIVKRDVALIYSLQKGSKRMWPSLGQPKKVAALLKHRDALTNGDGLNRIRSTPESLLSKIRLVSSEVFRTQELPSKFLPTGGACNQVSRRSGGALWLVDPLPLNSVLKQKHREGKLRGLHHAVEAWRKRTYAHMHTTALNSFERVSNVLDVKVNAIAEPGKFRIVTLGDGYLYSALQPLQGLMLSCWKNRGEATMRRDDLTKRIREIDQELPELPFFCSVDYESATDLLKKDASLQSFHGAYHLPGGDLGWLSLFSGRAIYPKDLPVPQRIVEHCEGQLMGHPLSFPLLCVINLAVYLHSLDEWVKAAEDYWSEEDEAKFWFRFRMRERMTTAVLVNGDDMLFKCDQALYEIFERVSASCGFKKSTGKQYLSKDFCMMNSQIFLRRGGLMQRFGYLNMKIILGVSLKQGDSKALPTQITRDLNRMVRLTPWTSAALPFAMKRWKKDWHNERFQPNWYLPVMLGGYGLDPEFAPESVRLTKYQRCMAATFVADPALGLYRTSGISLPTARLGAAMAKWQWVVGDWVSPDPSWDQLVEEDPWLGYLSYAFRASIAGDAPPGLSDIAVAKLVLARRLKPMSDARIDYYRHARLIASSVPECPAFSPLLVTSFDNLKRGYRAVPPQKKRLGLSRVISQNGR